MLHPKKWSVFCWGILVLWLAISIYGNIPLEPEPMKPAAATPGMSLSKITLTGCPFPYFEYAQSNTAPPTTTFRPWIIVLNVVLVAANLLGIIYSIQTLLPRFSISTLFIVTTCMALFLPACYLVFNSGNASLVVGFIYTVYFAPLIAMIPAFIYSRHVKSTAHIKLPKDKLRAA